MESLKPEMLTVHEALVLSRIGRTKFYAAIKAGQVDARKHGRRTLVPADSLRGYLAQLPRLAGAAR